MDSTKADWVGLADKLIDKTSDGLVFLADKIQDVAPVAWEIAMRQVYAEAIVGLALLAIFLIPSSWFFAKYMRVGIRKNWPDELAAPTVMSGFICIISTTLFVAQGTIWLKILINPEYYAILKIVEMAGLK